MGRDMTESEQARALAGAWSLAAAGLRDADADLAAALADEAFAREAEATLEALERPGAQGLRDAWRRFRAAALSAGPAGLSAERGRVLGHAVRGPCPPYELEYGSEHFLGKSHRLGDVAAFYRAFGVEVADDARERPDHAAVEAEFLSLVALKRALAEERGEGERAAVCRDAERRFLEEHPGRFLPAFARRVAEREPGGALAAAAALAAAVARAHAESLGIRPGSPDLELREIGSVEEETVVSCSPGPGPGASPDEREV